MGRVLAVDDDDLLLKTLARLIRHIGHEVESTPSALDALERVRLAAPDLLILDYQMPKMDGVTLYRTILQLLGSACPPVLFISGTPIDQVAAEVPAGVRAAYFGKPFDNGTFAREVNALLAPRPPSPSVPRSPVIIGRLRGPGVIQQPMSLKDEAIFS